MKISPEKLKKIYKNKGFHLKDLLETAGVSKTAYYSLLRKENILPKSIQALAKTLETKPTSFLKESRF